MPSWHPPDSDSGIVRDDESIIKVHNDAKTRCSWIWPFGIWNNLRDRRDDEQRVSPYDAKCNVAEIGAVNMGEIGAVRKRIR